MDVPVEKIAKRVHELPEFNPMLGLRGCRLGIVYPEITEMQARAVFEAAVRGAKRRHQSQAGNHDSARRLPEGIAIAIGSRQSRRQAKSPKEKKTKFNYLVGTMIEIPRGALVADEIAKDAAILQLRHQRPDPDLPRHEPRRFRFVPAATTRNWKSSSRIRLPPLTRPAWAH